MTNKELIERMQRISIHDILHDWISKCLKDEDLTGVQDDIWRSIVVKTERDYEKTLVDMKECV